MTSAPRTVTLLGSTGSIGTQAVDLVRANPERFRVTGLAAGGRDLGLLARQAVELRVDTVAVARGARPTSARRSSRPRRRRRAVVPARGARGRPGGDAAGRPRGRRRPQRDHRRRSASSRRSRRCAAGRTLALANKESLIIGGPLVKAVAKPGQVVPVDSEHSAIAQCLRGGTEQEVRRLVVTASGGPFRGRSRAELRGRHPGAGARPPELRHGARWSRRTRATLVNKGLEVIEAHLLFDVPFERIDVVVHPQQLIHSMVEFVDGATIAQVVAAVDAHPHRARAGLARPGAGRRAGVRLDPCADLDVRAARRRGVPGGRAGQAVGEAGGTAPAVYNAANEECVDAFHDGPDRRSRHRRHRRAGRRRAPPTRMDGGADARPGRRARRRRRRPAAGTRCPRCWVTMPRSATRRAGAPYRKEPRDRRRSVHRRGARHRPRRRAVHRAARDRPPRAREEVRASR